MTGRAGLGCLFLVSLLWGCEALKPGSDALDASNTAPLDGEVRPDATVLDAALVRDAGGEVADADSDPDGGPSDAARADAGGLHVQGGRVVSVSAVPGTTTLKVRAEGFELIDRQCAGALCVRGGLTP